jgi:hypothetical protein
VFARLQSSSALFLLLVIVAVCRKENLSEICFSSIFTHVCFFLKNISSKTVNYGGKIYVLFILDSRNMKIKPIMYDVG